MMLPNFVDVPHSLVNLFPCMTGEEVKVAVVLLRISYTGVSAKGLLANLSRDTGIKGLSVVASALHGLEVLGIIRKDNTGYRVVWDE
jgi:hypothetical protein